MTTPNPQEQLMLQLINRARLDPLAEMQAMFATGQSNINGAISAFGVSEALALSQVQGLEPLAPMAWNVSLGNSAKAYSNLMISEDQQSHFLDGLGLIQRLGAGGYNFELGGGAAENLYAFTQDVLHGHAGFYIDWGIGPGGIQSPPGHRNTILSPFYTSVGIGYVPVPPGQNIGPNAVTQHFGISGANPAPFLTGVAIDDLDNDDFYDIGEGLGGVTVTATGSNGTFSTTTWSSGGYTLDVEPGNYTVTFSGGGIGADKVFTVQVGNENVAVDAEKGGSDPVDPAGASNGNDDLKGTSGDDNIDLQAGNDKYVGLDGNDTVEGGPGLDTITGSAGNDTLRGGSESDVVNGNSGNDSILGGPDNDVLFGNPGLDTVSGGDGNDQISGNEDNDVLNGDAGNDSIFGGSGNDAATGGTGVDLIQGDDGSDTISGGADSDRIFGGKDADVLNGDGGADLIIGNQGSDIINGGDQADRLFGIGDGDIMSGGTGDDVMFGGTGDDSVNGEDGEDKIFGESGADTLKGGADDDKLYGGTQDDDILGGEGSDQMFGDADNDYMDGGGGEDTLFGGAGNDTLDGGRGSGVDRVTGGGGVDAFVFEVGDARLVITDFDGAGGELVDLVGINPGSFSGWNFTPLAGGSSTLVEFGLGNEIRFDGVAADEFQQGWFV